MEIFRNAEEFEWDEANITKNWKKHLVHHFECEEIFYNNPLVVKPNEGHSAQEKRYFALGKTNAGRNLFVVFTIREKKVRIISARDMNKKERGHYS